jgi:hypothetical protein
MSRRSKIFIFFTVLFSFICLYASDTNWEQMVLYSWNNEVMYRASSEYENPDPDPFNPGRFSAVRIFDGDKNTCWAEGVSGAGIGETLFFQIPENTRTLTIINGFAGSEELFFNNNRVKKMMVSLYIGLSPEAHVSEIAVQYFAVKYEKEFIIELLDTYDEQELSFPVSWDDLREFREKAMEIFKSEKAIEVGTLIDTVHYILRMEIQEVYKGAETDNTCISEIKIEKDFESVNSIYLSEDESAVFIDTDRKSGIEVDRDDEAVFQIINSSPDNQWLICIKMPKESLGRVETEYVLYNTFVPKKIDKKILGESVLDMYGFVKRDGKLFLEYFNSKTSRVEYLDLGKIELK